MTGARKSSWNYVLLESFCLTCLVLLLAYLFEKGVISPRQLGIGFLLLSGCLYVAILYRYTRGRGRAKQHTNVSIGTGTAKREGALKSIRVCIVVLVIGLVSGLWLTRGEPLLPRLIGAAINVLITGWLVFLLRKAETADSA